MFKRPNARICETTFRYRNTLLPEPVRVPSRYFLALSSTFLTVTTGPPTPLYRRDAVSFQSHSVVSYSELELSSRMYPSSSSKLDRSIVFDIRDTWSGEAVS